MDDGRDDLDRFDRVLGSAEAISERSRAAGGSAGEPFSVPVIKAAGIATGTSRAVRRCGEGRLDRVGRRRDRRRRRHDEASDMVRRRGRRRCRRRRLREAQGAQRTAAQLAPVNVARGRRARCATGPRRRRCDPRGTARRCAPASDELRRARDGRVETLDEQLEPDDQLLRRRRPVEPGTGRSCSERDE